MTLVIRFKMSEHPTIVEVLVNLAVAQRSFEELPHVTEGERAAFAAAAKEQSDIVAALAKRQGGV